MPSFCPFLIAPSVFSNVYCLPCETKEHGIRNENSFSAASWLKPFNKASANCVRRINHTRRENGTSTSALSMANVIVVITAAAFWLQEIFPPPILYILCLMLMLIIHVSSSSLNFFYLHDLQFANLFSSTNIAEIVIKHSIKGEVHKQALICFLLFEYKSHIILGQRLVWCFFYCRV